MNAASNSLSFAPNNYVLASAYSTQGKEFPEFAATSRLIEKKLAGIDKVETIVITAVDREEKKTTATATTTRELIICIPADYELGVHQVGNDLRGTVRSDVGFSYKDADKFIYEGVSGNIELLPASEGHTKGVFNIAVEIPGSEGQTFILKGEFQVLKAA